MKTNIIRSILSLMESRLVCCLLYIALFAVLFVIWAVWPLAGVAIGQNMAQPQEQEEAVSEENADPDETAASEAAAAQSDTEEPRDEQADDILGEAKSLDDVKLQLKENWGKLLQRFEAQGIRVDVEKKCVEVKGAIIRDSASPQYPIEYIVVSEGGNTHEAMILVKATPSLLNAALLSLGLTPGKTISSRLKDPPPPDEDIKAGMASAYEIIPPTGTVVYTYVKCDLWKERPIRYLEDLLVDLRTGKPMERTGWIYIGSRFARVLLGRDKVIKYMADMEGNIVACYLTGFGNSIFDINSADGINDGLFDVNPEAAPPMGSQVTLVFSINPL